jgi:streptogrisin D
LKHRRIPKRKAAVAGGAVVAIVAAGVTFQSANASDHTPQFDVKALTAPAAGDLAATLRADLGAEEAGAYYDAKAKALIVNVLSEDAAQTVREAGGKARVVENTLVELKSARQTLTDKATIPGTSWATDPVTNKVVVTADRTVEGADWAKLQEVVKGLGAKAELKKTAGEFRPFIAGGDAIHSGGGRCSLGFNVVKDGERPTRPRQRLRAGEVQRRHGAPERGEPLRRRVPGHHPGGRGDRRHAGDAQRLHHAGPRR